MDQEAVEFDVHDTAVVVLVGEDSNDLILIRSRRSGLWRFPGDRIRDEDFETSGNDMAPENTLMRIVRKRTGLVLKARDIRRVTQMNRSFGALYGYAGLADFKEFAPLDPENERILSLSEIPSLTMRPEQRKVFDTVISWIRS